MSLQWLPLPLELRDCVKLFIFVPFDKKELKFKISNVDQENPGMKLWNVKLVCDMSYLFADFSHFNIDISQWDVSLVKNVAYMFHGASSYNKSLECWDVSVCGMFRLRISVL